MNDTQRNFRHWTDLLLDPAASSGDKLRATQAWCAWALSVLGVDETQNPPPTSRFHTDTWLDTGKALSPLAAARCVREHWRTAVFLQAMDAAIRAARAQFPRQTIHVLEAGCGPLAPLSFPFALRYRPDEVCFTLLDYHALSLEGARRLAGELGVAASIRDYIAADATTFTLSESRRPHIIACEVMLRALSREPQVAATRNLAPQLVPGGFFVPEKIRVDAGLLDFARRDRLMRGEEASGSAVTELGEVFSLEASQVAALRTDDQGALIAASVPVPPHTARTPLHLFTRIQVFRDRYLGDFDSSLNLPERVRHSPQLAERGGELAFRYEISAAPGFRTREVIDGAERVMRS